MSASAAADFFFSSFPLSSFSTLGNALSAATRSTNVRRSERVSGATSTTVAVLCSSIHSSVSLAVRAAPVARNRSESRESFPPHKSSRSLRLPSWPPPKVSVALDMPPSLSAASAISPPRAWSVMPPIAAAASALRLALESLRGVARRRAFSLGGEATAASDDALVGPPPSSDARETLPPSPRRTLTDASGPTRELFSLSIPPSSAGRLACVIRRTSGTEQCSRTALRKATLAGSISCASSTRSMNPGRLGCAGAACTLLPSKSRCIISASATHRRFVPSCERRRFPSEYFLLEVRAEAQVMVAALHAVPLPRERHRRRQLTRHDAERLGPERLERVRPGPGPGVVSLPGRRGTRSPSRRVLFLAAECSSLAAECCSLAGASSRTCASSWRRCDRPRRSPPPPSRRPTGRRRGAR